MSNIEYTEHDDEHETLHAITSIFLAITSVFLSSTHSYKLYQDLFTTERKSLAHRRTKEVIDRDYKQISYLTLVTVILYTVYIITAMVQFNFLKKCSYVPRFLGDVAFWGSKAGLYLIYILRLHQIYGASAYGYRKKTMICWAVTVCVSVFGLWLLAQVGSVVAPLFRDDTDDKFPYYCQVDIQETWSLFMVLGALLMLFEIVACIGSIIAFMIPLNKVKKLASSTMNMELDGNEEMKALVAKIMYSGYKYKVIVTAASVFTLLWLILYMVNLVVIAAVLYQVDMIWNPICLLLMTPYYPSNLYYERLCYVCIRCCDPKGSSYKSAAALQEEPLARDAGDGTSKQTIDTSQAVKGPRPAQSTVGSQSGGQTKTVELSTAANAPQSTTETMATETAVTATTI